MGRRRDLPIVSSAWLDPIKEAQWSYWEKQFDQEMIPTFRRAVDLCFLDFRDLKTRHYDENRVSVSELRKKIGRLAMRFQRGLELDDDFVREQIIKLSGCDEFLPFPEQTKRALAELDEHLHDSTMNAPKPEAIFSAVFFDLFKENGMSVNLTSGSKRELSYGLDPVQPTAIEEFILHYILEESDPKIRDVDKIRKNIERFQKLARTMQNSELFPPPQD